MPKNAKLSTFGSYCFGVWLILNSPMQAIANPVECDHLIQERRTMPTALTEFLPALERTIWALVYSIRDNPEALHVCFEAPENYFGDFVDQTTNLLADSIMLTFQGIVWDRSPAPEGGSDLSQEVTAYRLYERALVSLNVETRWPIETKIIFSDVLEKLRDDALHYGFSVVYNNNLAGKITASGLPYDPTAMVAAARFVDPHTGSWVRVTPLHQDEGKHRHVDVQIIDMTYKDEMDLYRLSPEAARNPIEISPAALRQLGTNDEFDAFPVKIEMLNERAGTPLKKNDFHKVYAIRLITYGSSQAGKSAEQYRDMQTMKSQKDGNARPNFYCQRLLSGKYAVYFGPFDDRSSAEAHLASFSPLAVNDASVVLNWQTQDRPALFKGGIDVSAHHTEISNDTRPNVRKSLVR